MKRLLLFILLGSCLVAFPALAQQTNPSGKLFVDFSGTPGGNSAESIMTYIVKLFLGFSGVIAMLYVIYGGFMYLTAGINADQAKSGRKIVTNAVVGLIVIILSYIIVTVVVNSLNRLS